MLSRAPILAFVLGTAAALGTGATAKSAPQVFEITSKSTASDEPSPVLARTVEAPLALSWPERIADRIARTTQAPPVRSAARTYYDHLDPIVAEGRAVAMHVRDLDTGEVIYDHAGGRLQNPASSHKLVTAAAALELLGPDYRFETRVLRDARTLYLVGEGDPTLLLDDLHDLAAETIARGALEGVRQIVVDDSAFSGRRLGPGFDMGGDAAYLAPSGAASLQFNTVELTITPGGFGDDASIRSDPPSSGVRVVNRVRTGEGPGIRVETRRDGDTTVFEVRGSIPAGHATVVERVRVLDPAAFTGGAFADVLARMTGTNPLPVRRGHAPAVEPTVVHQSAPLTRVLGAALKFSNNFTAEQILRTLGWRHSGEPGDWDNGVAAVASWWRAAGLDPDDLVFRNGSGLDPDGRVTARALVAVLARAARDPRIGAPLFSALPAAGRDGTMEHRLELSDGRVRAKTGTMNGISTLTGVVASRDGDRRLGFSILMGAVSDTSRARRLQNRLAIQLLEYVERDRA